MTISHHEALEGIAFQSHLLALSVAVEAADQGTNDTGFAAAATELHELVRTAKNRARWMEQPAAASPPQ